MTKQTSIMRTSQKRTNNCKFHCCALSEDRKAEIRTSAQESYPGRWAEEVNQGPVCHCGLRSTSEPCKRHPA